MSYLHAFLTMLNAMSPYLLLGFLIAGLLHAFVPPAVYSRYLSGTGLRSVCLSALFGIPLPLCSCGVLPTAVALRRSGASRAASTSFLIATPQTGVDSIAATYSMMGAPFAVLRPVAALVTALFGGMAVGAMERRGKLGNDNEAAASSAETCDVLPRSVAGKIWLALRFGFFEMMQNIGRWLLLGLVVATLITVLVPDDFFVDHANNSVLNMVVILVIAVPMYICATGSIPIAAALMLKGLSPGCALVMLMAGPAANVASMLVISRSFGTRAAACYIASIVAGAMGFGLLIDLVPSLNNLFVEALPNHGGAHGMGATWFGAVCGIVLLALLVAAMTANYCKSLKLKKYSAMKQFKVKGMMCNHCKANVERGVASLAGVTRVEVDLAQGIVYVDGTVSDEAVREKITELGYECL